RPRTDGDVHLGAGLIEDHVASPMSRPTGQLGEFLGFAFCFRLTGLVLESHEAVRVSHVKIITPECEPVRASQTGSEHEALVDPAVAIRVAEDRYAVGLRFAHED